MLEPSNTVLLRPNKAGGLGERGMGQLDGAEAGGLWCLGQVKSCSSTFVLP